jgi:multiple sugar transport system substrate-binding protein
MYTNLDLFKEAGLAVPPQKYGDKYTLDGKEVEWNFDTIAEVARKLTVDKNGNDATAANFDAKNIVQYGFVPQWVDEPRAFGTYFCAHYPVKDGKADVPECWKKAYQWYYDGMWGDQPFIPNQAAMDSDLMKGNAFSSGKVAMGLTHLWYTCCVDTKNVPNWDYSIVPSFDGKVTAKMHGDTFAIMEQSQHPKEAFEVYQYMLGEGAADLYKIYGGLPARKSQQADFFKGLDEKFAPNKVNWQVALDAIPMLDAPNHELGLPNNAKANDAFQKLGGDLRSNDKLDLEKRIAEFEAELNTIYAEKPAQ